MQISVHTADVKTVLRTFSLEVPAREKDDLSEEPIVVKLRKVRLVPYHLSILTSHHSPSLLLPLPTH